MSTIQYAKASDRLRDQILTGRKTQVRNRWLVASVIAACMAGVSLISRLYLVHKSLRLDESQSMWQASHSIGGTLHAVALDVHVPMYHLMLHFWMFAFGNAVPTVRLMSLIFFLATIPLVYLIARQVMSLRWSLITTVLFSFAPFMNWYANEARMYTLLLFFAALSQYFFLRILRTGKGWWWYTLTVVLGVYTHYFFLFTLAAEGLFYLFNRKLFPRRSFIKFLLIGLAAIASLAPWLVYVHALGSASGTRPHLPSPSSVDFFNVYSQFLFGFQNDRINTILLSSWPVVMLVALLAVRRNRASTPELNFIATLATVPVILAFILSLVVTPFFLSRYMVSSVAPLFVLILWLFSRYAKRAAAVLVVALFILTGLTSVQQDVSASTPVREDYRAVADYANQTIQPQDLVVLSAPFTLYPFEYYYHGPAQIDTLPAWNRTAANGIPAFDASKLASEVSAQNMNHRYIYLVLSQDQGYESTIRNYYRDHFKLVKQQVYSEDLTLYVYQVGYYTVPSIAQETKSITVQ